MKTTFKKVVSVIASIILLVGSFAGTLTVSATTDGDAIRTAFEEYVASTVFTDSGYSSTYSDQKLIEYLETQGYFGVSVVEAGSLYVQSRLEHSKAGFTTGVEGYETLFEPEDGSVTVVLDYNGEQIGCSAIIPAYIYEHAEDITTVSTDDEFTVEGDVITAYNGSANLLVINKPVSATIDWGVNAANIKAIIYNGGQSFNGEFHTNATFGSAKLPNLAAFRMESGAFQFTDINMFSGNNTALTHVSLPETGVYAIPHHFLNGRAGVVRLDNTQYTERFGWCALNGTNLNTIECGINRGELFTDSFCFRTQVGAQGVTPVFIFHNENPSIAGNGRGAIRWDADYPPIIYANEGVYEAVQASDVTGMQEPADWRLLNLEIHIDHVYDDEIDPDCNECGEWREVYEPACPHEYDTECDPDCNLCGEWREVWEHEYDDEYDPDCNFCGISRDDWCSHSYDHGCDTDCNMCGLYREFMGHVYDGDMDPDCNECGEMRDTDMPVCPHDYDDEYDADCNWCGEWREAPEPIECLHEYDSECDPECNLCGEWREVSGHEYDNACDADCNICGDVREVGDHVFDNECDTECNECGFLRGAIEHAYDHACDIDCNECGDIRETEGHKYDHACDTDCNECGDIRKIEGHKYDHACDADCNICGALREVGDHVYANDCDVDCNECGDIREVGDHTYDNDCDVDCNSCGKNREVGDHQYDNACDAGCNVCGKTREVGDHVYDSDTDTDCNECGATRKVTCTHYYDNACDANCNGCGETREVGNHVYDSETDTDCNECGATRNETCTHYYDADCDEDCNLCGVKREVKHTYSGEHDTKCDKCGAERVLGNVTGTIGSLSYTITPDANGGTVTITACDPTASGDVNIPGTINGCPVTVIASMAFKSCKDVTNIQIPEGVTVIQKQAFSGCISLTGISVPDTVYIIGDAAFEYCSGLTSIVVPEGVTVINPNMFSGCTKLEFVSIPSTVNSIGANAFSDCPSLNNVNYAGGDQSNITIDESNKDLIDANWSDNICSGEHTYSAGCDVTCNLCNWVRTATITHTYDNACDSACNVCGTVRVIPHAYSNACDSDCNLCGAIRTVAGHQYTNACDASCNTCGATRTVEGHRYDNDTDPDCNECGETRHVGEMPTFVVDDVTVRVDKTFTVAVRVTNNIGIISAKLAISYDESKLELLSYEEQDFTDLSYGPEENNPFIVNWCDSLNDNTTDDGVFVLLTFRAKADAEVGETAVSVSYDPEDVYNYDFENVTFDTVNGTVNIIDYIPGDLNDDDVINNKDLGLLLRYVNGWAVDINEFAADVTGDGIINNKDLGILQRYVNGWNVELQ